MSTTARGGIVDPQERRCVAVLVAGSSMERELSSAAERFTCVFDILNRSLGARSPKAARAHGIGLDELPRRILASTCQTPN